MAQALLTFGWQDDPASHFSAAELHRRAENSDSYQKEIVRRLGDSSSPLLIDRLDSLFRRRIGGFADIRKFVDALAEIADDPKNPRQITCNIDVFAYAFLKAAENFDCILPEKEGTGLFRNEQPRWNREMRALQRFEQTGRRLPEKTKKRYLRLRKIITRTTARDERRLLATLLISGPSSLKQINAERDISPVRCRRIIAVFRMIGVLEKENNLCRISEHALPGVLFCLHSTLGLDFFNLLEERS